MSKRVLLARAEGHPETLASIVAWYKIARAAEWSGLHQVRESFPSADQVGSVLIFNISGNKYRLICRVEYTHKRLFVKGLLTHAEYNRKGWMKWA